MDVKTLRVLNDYPKGSLWSDRALLLYLSVEKGGLTRNGREVLSLSEGGRSRRAGVSPGHM